MTQAISTRIRAVVAGSVILLAAGCSKDEPSTPLAPSVPACQANNTATVSFRNRSSGTTYTVQWDGATITTLAPGQDSQVITAAAGVQHTVRFFIANTNLLACNAAFPVLAACSDVFYSCNLP
jgi:hypothetical protein